MNQQIGDLTDKLAPATPDFIAECLDKLKSGGMMVPKGIAPTDFVREYMIALGGVPAHGLARAVAKLKRGEYPEVEHDFLPRPSMLAAIARLETKTIREDLVRLQELRTTLQEATTPREKTDPEQLARIRQLHAQFKAAHAEAKVSERFHQRDEQMTPEQAEYWEKISAIRDATSISEEQMAFRRKIGKGIDQTPKQQEAAE